MILAVFQNMGVLPEYPDNHIRVMSFMPWMDEDAAIAEAKRVIGVGIPFLIMDSESVPEDRDGWEPDFSNPDGYGEASTAGR